MVRAERSVECEVKTHVRLWDRVGILTYSERRGSENVCVEGNGRIAESRCFRAAVRPFEPDRGVISTYRDTTVPVTEWERP